MSQQENFCKFDSAMWQKNSVIYFLLKLFLDNSLRQISANILQRHSFKIFQTKHKHKEK